MAQSKPLASVPFRGEAEWAYVDRPGDVYIRFKSGRIIKYDVNGKPVSEYNPSEDITLFDPRDGARAFMYSAKGNWYTYSFFGSNNKIKLKEEYAIEPAMACSSGDKDLWVFDRADFSIKKINTSRQTVDVEVALPESLIRYGKGVRLMREYQNFLFLLMEDSSLHMFSSMGKLVKTLPSDSPITWFNFLGLELYYPQGDKLVFYDLFDGDLREIAAEPGAKFTLLTDARAYRIYNDRLEIYAPGM